VSVSRQDVITAFKSSILRRVKRLRVKWDSEYRSAHVIARLLRDMERLWVARRTESETWRWYVSANPSCDCVIISSSEEGDPPLVSLDPLVTHVLVGSWKVYSLRLWIGATLPDGSKPSVVSAFPRLHYALEWYKGASTPLHCSHHAVLSVMGHVIFSLFTE
jgi:hypothetical protein